jgi:hypothetical protein
MAILFYRVREPYGAFSNFSAHPVELDGETWPTVEHYFQATKFPHDPDLQRRIREAPSPTVAKRLAWAGAAKPRPDWDAYRDEVMLRALRAKAEQHPDFRALLLSTGDEELVEHTARDAYWGDGGDGTGPTCSAGS